MSQSNKLLKNTFITSMLIAMSAPIASIAGDSVDADISKLYTTTIPISSNGQTYTMLEPSPIERFILADIHVKIDAGVSGRVKSWSTWLKYHSQATYSSTSGGSLPHFKAHSFNQGYAWNKRPKTVNKTVQVAVPSSAYATQLIGQCNILASRLSQQGLSNTQIFSQDRLIPIYFFPDRNADISGIEGHSFIGIKQGIEANIICKKWQGTQIPTSQGGLVAEETEYVVTDSSLTILPQSTVGGACNVTLSGVIKTLKPNAPIKFKYRHQDGHTGLVKDSQVYDVITGPSKTAMFSHQFDIANLDGQDEHGTLQMIGVSPEFHTKKKLYELACSTPSPSALTTDLGPLADITYLIQERALVGNQSCPVKIRLVGTVKTRGARQGKALFVGNAYLSQAFNFDLAANAQQQFIADRTINWDLNTGTPQGASHMAHGNTGGNALRFKDIRFGFNVSTRAADNNPTTGLSSLLATAPSEDYTLAATTPQQHIRLQCEMPAQAQQNLPLSLNAKAPSATVPKAKVTVLAQQAALKPVTARLQSNAKADIAIRALNLAGNTFNKAGMVTLNARDAIRYENGRCLFDLTYSLENNGQVSTTAFKSQLTQEGILINQHQNIVLEAGEFDSFYRTVGLKTGINQLRIDADTDKKISESNENNNQLVKRYNLVGRCVAATKQLGSAKATLPSDHNRAQPAQGKLMLERQR